MIPQCTWTWWKIFMSLDIWLSYAVYTFTPFQLLFYSDSMCEGGLCKQPRNECSTSAVIVTGQFSIAICHSSNQCNSMHVSDIWHAHCNGFFSLSIQLLTTFVYLAFLTAYAWTINWPYTLSKTSQCSIHIVIRCAGRVSANTRPHQLHDNFQNNYSNHTACQLPHYFVL